MKNENDIIIIKKGHNGRRKYYKIINEAGDMVRIDIKDIK